MTTPFVRHTRLPLAAAAAMLLAAVTAQGQGVFVTGHDPDFHAFRGGNTTGAQHIIQDSLAFVTNRPSNSIGSILLVTDLVNPGVGYSDPRSGLTAAGYTYTVADNGAAGGSVLDLHTVNFASYNAIVIASDFGGWLRQSELDILDARAAEVISYINGGGGLVAFAESGSRGFGLTTHGQYGYLPFLVTGAVNNQSESGFTVTPFGQTLGLVDSDINGNASHNVFTATGGLNVVDTDPQGDILSLGFRGTISSGGTVPEPGTVALAFASLATSAGFLLRRRRA